MHTQPPLSKGSPGHPTQHRYQQPHSRASYAALHPLHFIPNLLQRPEKKCSNHTTPPFEFTLLPLHPILSHIRALPNFRTQEGVTRNIMILLIPIRKLTTFVLSRSTIREILMNKKPTLHREVTCHASPAYLLLLLTPLKAT